MLEADSDRAIAFVRIKARILRTVTRKTLSVIEAVMNLDLKIGLLSLKISSRQPGGPTEVSIYKKVCFPQDASVSDGLNSICQGSSRSLPYCLL